MFAAENPPRMTCPACQAPNWDQARFCQSCGGGLTGGVPAGPHGPPGAPVVGPPPPMPREFVPAQQTYPPPPVQQQMYPPPQAPGGWGSPPPAQQYPPQHQQQWGSAGWGSAAPMGVGIDWRAVGYGAAAMACGMTGAFTTQFKALFEQALATGVQPNMTFWYLTWLSLSAAAGMITVHYSKSRSAMEAGIAGAAGIVATMLLLSMINPTIQTYYGPTPYYRTDFGTILMNLIGSTAAGAVGGAWYANWLRQKGR